MNGDMWLHSCIAQVYFERENDMSVIMSLSWHIFNLYFYIHLRVTFILHTYRVENHVLNNLFFYIELVVKRTYIEMSLVKY